MNIRKDLFPFLYRIHKFFFSHLYFSFVKSLEPNFFNTPKKVFGKPGDGSYVLPVDLISDNLVLLSFGVADDISFEEDFLKSFPNTLVYTFDPSISELPNSKYKINFDMVGVSGTNDIKRNLITFDKIVEGKNIISREIILKMDIEGWEWNVIFNTNFSKFDIPIIVAEFHVMTINTIHEFLFFPFHFYKRYKAFQKLKEDYYIFHLHANNYRYSFFKHFSFPWCFEITFVRKTIFLKDFEKDILNLNFINCLDRKDIQFPFFK